MLVIENLWTDGSQTGTSIGIFRASGNAGREGERLLAPFARPKKDRRYAAHRLRRSRQEGGPEQSPAPSSRGDWIAPNAQQVQQPIGRDALGAAVSRAIHRCQ